MVVNKGNLLPYIFFGIICFQSCRSYNYLLKRSVCCFHSVHFGTSRLQNTGSFNMMYQCRLLKWKSIKDFVCVHVNEQRVDHFIGFGSLYYFSSLFSTYILEPTWAGTRTFYVLYNLWSRLSCQSCWKGLHAKRKSSSQEKKFLLFLKTKLPQIYTYAESFQRNWE